VTSGGSGRSTNTFFLRKALRVLKNLHSQFIGQLVHLQIVVPMQTHFYCLLPSALCLLPSALCLLPSAPRQLILCPAAPRSRRARG
jgi:hypothetical protein